MSRRREYGDIFGHCHNDAGYWSLVIGRMPLGRWQVRWLSMSDARGGRPPGREGRENMPLYSYCPIARRPPVARNTPGANLRFCVGSWGLGLRESGKIAVSRAARSGGCQPGGSTTTRRWDEGSRRGVDHPLVEPAWDGRIAATHRASEIMTRSHQCQPSLLTICVWVAPADCSAGAPADPYVHALTHTVLHLMVSLRYGRPSGSPPLPAADAVPAYG